MNIERDAVLSVWSMKISLCFQFFFCLKKFIHDTFLIWCAHSIHTHTRESPLRRAHDSKAKANSMSSRWSSNLVWGWLCEFFFNFPRWEYRKKTCKRWRGRKGEKVEDKQSLSFAAQCHTSYTFLRYSRAALLGCTMLSKLLIRFFSSSFFPFFPEFFRGWKIIFFLFPHYSSYSSLVTEQ